MWFFFFVNRIGTFLHHTDLFSPVDDQEPKPETLLLRSIVLEFYTETAKLKSLGVLHKVKIHLNLLLINQCSSCGSILITRNLMNLL